MNLSILQIALKLAQEICERTEKGEIRDLDVMAETILSDCKGMAVEIIQVIIQHMNEEIREDKRGRKEQGLILKEKDRPRQIYTHLGQINFTRDYFYDKGNGHHISVLDKMLGIDKYERVGGAVSADLVSRATDHSYAKSTNIVTGGDISRQTVRNQLLKVELPEVEPREENKCVKELHIFADEDHAHMQKPDKIKGKKSKIVPLVTVTEGIGRKNKGRNRTINPMHFSAEDFNTKAVWERAEGYLWKAYDLEKVEKIYVHGDGGRWIKNGLENLSQTAPVIDEFHFLKYLRAISRILPKRNVRAVIIGSLERDDKSNADRFIQDLLNSQITEKEEKRIREFGGFLFENWEKIRTRIIEDIPGSCTEGLVSHILAERISRNPMGWSIEGLGKVVSARLYIKNGGKITKESFKREKGTTYSEYLEKIIEEKVSGAIDFSIFDPGKEVYDTASPTQILIKKTCQMQSLLI